MNKYAVVILVGASFGLSSCGGGGGGAGTCVGSAAVCSPTSSASPPATTPLPGAVGEALFASSTSVAGQCVAPRPSGTVDAYSGATYNDSAGTLATELSWIRSFVNETYLWYDEVPAIDLAQYQVGASVPYFAPATNARSTVQLRTPIEVTDGFFNSQRTPLTTASGKPKDQFHFTYRTSEWSALLGAGATVGFGFELALLTPKPPRKVVVAYNSPGTPAASNVLVRGVQIIGVNGVDIVNGADVGAINEGLFSPVSGKSYTFQVLDPGSTTVRSVTMTAGSVTSAPVQNVKTVATPTGSVGYMLFNDHLATSESQLIAAVNQLKSANNGAGVSDLVLDIRYNGGGLLDIASELAYMIASAPATDGKVFETLRFNRKTVANPARRVTPFLGVTQGFSAAEGQPLPRLSLPRVFVLTSGNTCSASEAIMNGLRGVGVDVVQVGTTTCGKPYGFFPTENCSTTYFTVQFQGVNNAGFGDYADGFTPDGSGTGITGNHLAGCVVGDDFSHALGDPAEAQLAAALQYRSNGTCPALAASKRAVSGKPTQA
ncbi:MAG: hypothetical protein H7327_12370, partial [Herminiimonas sp.]|nr:hypothetical protein [Herminiimonas sp.]